jgi:hypothetical protein
MTPPPPSFFSRRVDHERLYSIFLIVLAVSTVVSIPLGLFVYFLRVRAGLPVQRWHIPDWVGPWNAAICSGYFVAMVMTAWLRRVEPAAGKRVSRVLNYALLPAAPFGTALGIYGLTRVDRPDDAHHRHGDEALHHAPTRGRSS